MSKYVVFGRTVGKRTDDPLSSWAVICDTKELALKKARSYLELNTAYPYNYVDIIYSEIKEGILLKYPEEPQFIEMEVKL